MPVRGSLLPLSLAVLLAVPARTAWPAAAAGRIEKVVAGSDRLYALRGGAVETLDGAGRLLASCRRFEAPPARNDVADRADRASIGAPEAEEALAAAGLADDDDSTDAEDALEDEGIGPRPRPRRAPLSTVEARDVASTAGSRDVWIATSSGLYRGTDGSCAPAALRGRALLLVARANGAIAAASEDLLWLLDDGQAPGVILVGLTSRPRALALGDDAPAGAQVGAPVGAKVFVGDDEGLLAVDAGGGATRTLDQPVGALAVCDGVGVALATDGAYAWRGDDPPARVADRPPARALACGPSPAARFIATGLGVWTSPDGADWTERDETLGRSVASAAANDRIWVAIDGELLALDEIGPPAATTALATASDPAPIAALAVAAPAFPWPRLTFAFAAHETVAFGARDIANRDGWSIVALLAFPLGRSARRGPDARGAAALAADGLERDAALAAEARRLSSQAGDDETRARLRALDQERRALR